jgi:hypothetical protein
VAKKSSDAQGAMNREVKKEGLPPKIEGSPVLSAFMNEVRAFFEGEEGSKVKIGAQANLEAISAGFRRQTE